MHREARIRHVRAEMCARLLLQQTPGRVSGLGLRGRQQGAILAEPHAVLLRGAQGRLRGKRFYANGLDSNSDRCGIVWH